MKKKYVVISIIALCLLVWITFTQQSNKSNLKKVNNKEQTQLEPKQEISVENQNDLVVTNFIRELLGNDHQLLVELFEHTSLPVNIDDMSEDEYAKYAIKVGNLIKMNKVLVKGKILAIQREGQECTYKISLEFKDGTSKEIILTVRNAKIITPLKDLL